MIRVVVEVPETACNRAGQRVLTEKDAVRWVHAALEDSGCPSRRVKAYSRVRTAERVKVVGENDVATRLRRVRDEINDILREE